MEKIFESFTDFMKNNQLNETLMSKDEISLILSKLQKEPVMIDLDAKSRFHIKIEYEIWASKEIIHFGIFGKKIKPIIEVKGLKLVDLPLFVYEYLQSINNEELDETKLKLSLMNLNNKLKLNIVYVVNKKEQKTGQIYPGKLK